MYTPEEVLEIFKEKFKNNDFRIIGNKVQQSKTIELQNIQVEFTPDHPWIVREPNYDYVKREIEWYESQSLSVNDIPGQTPKMWEACASKDDKKYINSNYGWMVFSAANCRQFDNCVKKLLSDPHTREAVMIYQRPEMQYEYNRDGMHDFCCTWGTHLFINEDTSNNVTLKYIIYQRSCDSVFGLCNDYQWHYYLANKVIDELRKDDRFADIKLEPLVFNFGSLHVYERHFKFLEQ